MFINHLNSCIGKSTKCSTPLEFLIIDAQINTFLSFNSSKQALYWQGHATNTCITNFMHNYACNNSDSEMESHHAKQPKFTQGR